MNAVLGFYVCVLRLQGQRNFRRQRVVQAQRRDPRVAFDLNAPTVTVGIRGTGVYAAADPDKTYLCTCYGRVDLTATADPNATETIQSRHHDAARYIYAQPVNGKLIAPAPFIDHTDLELMTLEALVGREVPFALGDKDYQAPRRDY